MIVPLVNDLFAKIGHTWKIGGKDLSPTDDDLQKTLDRAAEVLYTEGVGSRLEVGGLIIEKREHGHDVYVFVGNYI